MGFVWGLWCFALMFAVISAYSFFRHDDQTAWGAFFPALFFGALGLGIWGTKDDFGNIRDLESGITYCVKSKRDDHQLVLGYRKDGEDREVRTTSDYLEYGLLTDCFTLDERKKIHAVQGGLDAH